MISSKRVAILSPVAWRTPPRKYGAWETVASNISEGLVARGWDVTLFASGDSLTQARLHAVVAKGYEEDRSIDPKVAEYLHIAEVFEHAAEFDLIHSHYDFMALAYTRLVKTPVPIIPEITMEVAVKIFIFLCCIQVYLSLVSPVAPGAT